MPPCTRRSYFQDAAPEALIRVGYWMDSVLFLLGVDQVVATGWNAGRSLMLAEQLCELEVRRTHRNNAEIMPTGNDRRWPLMGDLSELASNGRGSRHNRFRARKSEATYYG